MSGDKLGAETFGTIIDKGKKKQQHNNTMKALKTLILTAALVCGGIMTANAQLGGGQKIVYVDSEYIMENIPEYGDAQQELNALSSKWQNEVKAVYDKVSEMYSKYQTEMLLLSEDQKRAREQAIVDKEQEAKNYAFILDLASGTSILYANDRNDVSDEVLDQLGNVMQTVRREDRRKASQGNVGGAGASNSSKGNSSKTIKPKK